MNRSNHGCVTITPRWSWRRCPHRTPVSPTTAVGAAHLIMMESQGVSRLRSEMCSVIAHSIDTTHYPPAATTKCGPNDLVSPRGGCYSYSARSQKPLVTVVACRCANESPRYSSPCFRVCPYVCEPLPVHVARNRRMAIRKLSRFN